MSTASQSFELPERQGNLPEKPGELPERQGNLPGKPGKLPERPGRFSVLANRDFRMLWSAGLFRYNARGMEMIVLGWMVLELTDSPFLVGLLGFFRMAAMPVLGLPAGILADRANRKSILVMTEGITAALSIVLSVLVFMDEVKFWHIGALTLAMGTSWVTSFPSRSSLVQDLVGSNRLTNAMSLDMAAMNGSRMMAPVLGGLLLAFVGAKGATLIMAVLYSIGFLMLFKVRAPERTISIVREPIRQLLSEGLRHVLKSQVLLAAILITVVANLFLFPYMLMIPVFARDELGVGPFLMGIMAAIDGLGALVGSVFLASRRTIRGPGRIFAYGTTGAIVAVLSFALSPVYGLSLVFLFVVGLFFSTFATMQPTLMLLGSPPKMRGRAMGVMMIAIGAGPIGFVLTGATSEAWGAPTAVAINSVIGFVLLASIVALFPSIRKSQTFPDQEAGESSESDQAQ